MISFAGKTYASDTRPGLRTSGALSLRGGLRGDGARRVDCGLVAGFPGPGHQLVDALGGMIGQASEHVSEPGARIDVVELAGRDQRIDGGGPTTPFVGAGEGPVATPERHDAQGALGRIIR